ncbi:kinase-like protein [Cucurbitaria berberidis CBS 394.84]|uniref:Kinase-like protein n=1 Tax=Cucurbitaria berberidis CBS 394.84 TaxID=1168544 RepID=A0A9P4GRN1_9PLEO|nr:kinase-like protein [Cucurbitaria berberidis CBS 394.84]KAF1850274.1 kinase-like protein [Cucurbitaria berberidis CBS 394.84]
MSVSGRPNVRISIIAADGLYKRDTFFFPNPFTVLSIDDQQTRTTTVGKKTINPYWNEDFDVIVNEESVLTARIFDQRHFKKKHRGFLGTVKVRIGNVLDLNTGGDEYITRDLKKEADDQIIYGKLVLSLSTNISRPTESIAQISDPTLENQAESSEKPPSYSASSNPAPNASQQSNIERLPVTSELPADMRRPKLTEERLLSSRSTASEDALSAWNRRFASRQVRLAREEPEPFIPGRRLGGGGIGVVHEVKLDGISLALKRTYAKRLTDYELNEIKILGQITERRHKHIVELIGSYIHRQRGVYELGLLIWPVAHCDLAVHLQDISLLGQWIEQAPEVVPRARTEDLDLAIESLSTMTGFRIPWSLKGALEKGGTRLYELALGGLRSNVGCIANAVAWLHHQGIRHKDLKPSQILLSPDGLWLTDFGWSKDISELTQSATDGGHNITLKYQAPERAQQKPCGRSEDIFALGCIFVEIAHQLARPVLEPKERWTPWKQRGWYFQANLKEVEAYLLLLKRSLGGFELNHSLPELITGMLALEPDDRPSVDQVIGMLSKGGFFDECCQPEFVATSSNLNDDQHFQRTSTWPELNGPIAKLNIIDPSSANIPSHTPAKTIYGAESIESFPSTNPFRSMTNTPSNGSKNPFRQKQNTTGKLDVSTSDLSSFDGMSHGVAAESSNEPSNVSNSLGAQRIVDPFLSPYQDIRQTSRGI